MKYSVLDIIITSKAHQLKENAGYSGAWNDGGSGSLLGRLDEFKNELIIQHDLRPSEFNLLNDMDVGEPVRFRDIINDYKFELAKNIKL